MHGSDVIVIVLSILFLFILSHILVDKEFPEDVRNGAVAVMSILSILYLIFGVLI